MELEAVAPEDSTEHARWVEEIRLYEKEAEKWTERGKRIVKRYKDERSVRETADGNRRYNILYSNIQTLLPAYFARSPKPDIERRFKDKDDVGRLAAEVWERCVSYFVENNIFRHSMKQAVIDRLLPGRGMVWVRYVPHMRDIQIAGNDEVKDEGVEITDDVIEGDDDGEITGTEEIPQEVYNEEVVPDYIYWEDFGHNVARNWQEVRAVWRKAYLTRGEVRKRFGKEIGDKITLDYTPRGLNDEKIADDMKKATIYEIWDKPSKKALWLHKDFPKLLDDRDDPLQLEDFFPCPAPLTPTLTTDSMIPIPDFAQYQDQAKELDDLTGRIAAITKAIKVAGVYDASAAGVERVLSEGTENKLIPVEQWAVFGEKGGLKGVMDLLPMKEIMETLLGLYEAREKVKQDLYEITGISDIIRGATKASETATAQNIKSKYAAIRLDDGQKGVERFARDLVRIIAQIIAIHFGLDTIKMISGVKLLTQQEKIQMQQQQAMAQQQPQPGMPPAPQQPPLTEEQQELLANPTWEEVGALLKDNAMRCFRIDIETDSTILPDHDSEKQQAVEFLTAAGGFIAQAAEVAVQAPDMVPLLMEMLMFGVRRFPIGKQLETTFELTMKNIEKTQEQAKLAGPKPDPEMQKAQADSQYQQAQLQLDQKKHQDQMQLEQFRVQSDAQLQNKDIEMKHSTDLQKHQMTTSMAEKPATNVNFPAQDSLDGAAQAITEMAANTAQTNEQMLQAIMAAVQGMQQTNQGLLQALTQPKQVSMQTAEGRILTATVN